MRIYQIILSSLIIILLIFIPSDRVIRANQMDQQITPMGLVENRYYRDSSGVELAPLTLDPDLEAGFPVQTWHDGGTFMAWPAINTLVGNIDADPELEILVTGIAKGPLYAFNYDGTLVPGWPVVYYDRTHYSSLGNLDDQYHDLEVFTGQYIHRVPETPPGPMLAYNGDGSLISGWPKDSMYDIWGPAILADINGDFLDEIFQYEGLFVLNGYLANSNPLLGFSVYADDPSYAVADLDGDGNLEFVTFNDATSEGAYLVAYNHDGTQVENFHLFFQPYRHPFPVIGDVDNDGEYEIVVFSYIEDDPYFAIYIVGPSGTLERDIPLFNLNTDLGDPSSAPALADMDGDHVPEIVVGCGAGITVYKGDGTVLPGFPVIWGQASQDWVGNSAPVVGDVDGDLLPDIVITSRHFTLSLGKVYVYNSAGQLNPHFPKSLNIGGGAVPAIGDIDLDGRNEIIITGEYWDGYPGFYDKVWAYDLHGSNYGNVEWGQLGGGPKHWGLYPPPPLYPGVNLYLAIPGRVLTDPEQLVSIDIRYGNQGLTVAHSVTLTATLETGLEYFNDTSGISPTITGQNIVWNLPDMGYNEDEQFLLNVSLPHDASYGDLYHTSFALSNNIYESDPTNNVAQARINVSRSVFLPVISR